MTRAILGIAAMVTLLLAAGYTGQGDYADALVMDGMRKERKARDTTAELLCSCPKLNGRVWLRLAVTQQADRGFCRARCFYADGSETSGRM